MSTWAYARDWAWRFVLALIATTTLVGQATTDDLIITSPAEGAIITVPAGQVETTVTVKFTISYDSPFYSYTDFRGQYSYQAPDGSVFFVVPSTTASYNSTTGEYTMSVTVRKPPTGSTGKITVKAQDADFGASASDTVHITVQ